MPLIRDIRKWFYPRRKFKPPLRTIINPYTMKNAAEEERLLMLAGLARSPHEARYLLKKHAATAKHIIETQPPPRKRSLKRRFKLLIRRIEGHDPRDPYQDFEHDVISVRYRHRR